MPGEQECRRWALSLGPSSASRSRSDAMKRQTGHATWLSTDWKYSLIVTAIALSISFAGSMYSLHALWTPSKFESRASNSSGEAAARSSPRSSESLRGEPPRSETTDCDPQRP